MGAGQERIPTLIISGTVGTVGTVGAGKSQGAEISWLLERRRIRQGLVDLDHLAKLNPAPDDDPHNGSEFTSCCKLIRADRKIRSLRLPTEVTMFRQQPKSPPRRRFRMPTEDQVAVAVETLNMLSDPTRLRILWVLLHGERSVNDLASIIGARPAAVSQQLAKLRLARVVRQRREGTRMFYTAEDTHVRQLIHETLYHGDHVVQGLPDHGPPT